MEESNHKTTKNKYDLIIGIFGTLFGAFRLYQHLQAEPVEWNYRILLAISFVGYGIFLLYRYFQNNKQ